MKKYFLLTFHAALCLLAANSALSTDSLFTSQQAAKLKATGREIIVPLYLPTGFRVEKVIVDRARPETPSYSILFAGPGDTCFIVEMGTEVGDMIVEDNKGKLIDATSEIKNPILGTTLFWNTSEYLGTDWFPPYKNTAYCITGDIDHSALAKDKASLAICKKRMEGLDFKKVVKSLGILKGGT